METFEFIAIMIAVSVSFVAGLTIGNESRTREVQTCLTYETDNIRLECIRKHFKTGEN